MRVQRSPPAAFCRASSRYARQRRVPRASESDSASSASACRDPVCWAHPQPFQNSVECAAACDLYDGRHILAREIVRADLPVTRRYKELLDNKDIDCIIAAVPDHWHRQIVVDAVSAGKDIYCEKPMSHSAGDGIAMVDAAKKSGRIVQIGSQRVSSQICAKARELIAQGILGDLMLVEGWMGRNDPNGAWQYPPPPDLSPQNLDWDTWQGDVRPKRAFDPLVFARWRAWKEYGTGVAGDLLVHLISGMMFMLDINEPPKKAMSVGGIRHWKDGRNMPDVHAVSYYYGDLPVYMRLNSATEMPPELYRFQGSKGILEVSGNQRELHAPVGQGHVAELLHGKLSARDAASVCEAVARRERCAASRRADVRVDLVPRTGLRRSAAASDDVLRRGADAKASGGGRGVRSLRRVGVSHGERVVLPEEHSLVGRGDEDRQWLAATPSSSRRAP